ncbi:MAG: gliding motility-associated C-terminal domain-containing protein [Saprospiraceae bacterium]|nr:gliding motility-associated C-terminal domain-containing protein [Saprospiraceae bacterium]
MTNSRAFLLSVIIFLLGVPLYAQLDTIHRIPPCHSRSDRGQQYLYLTTPEPMPFQVSLTTGTGSAFTDGNGNVISTITLSNAMPQRIYLGNGDAFPNDNLVTLTRMDQLHTPLNDKGIVLSASSPFYANLRVRTSQQAGSLTAKGNAALGQSFRVGHVFNAVVTGFNTTSRSNFFSLMATADNTQITVSGFEPGIGLETSAGLVYPVGSYSVTLQKGQCYVASVYVDQTKPKVNENGLIGTLVESDQPIVMNCGTWLGSPFTYDLKDIGIDQIVPVDRVGTEYVTIRGDGHPDLETPIVVATEDKTDVYLNGSPIPLATLDAGDFVRIPSSNYTVDENLYILATRPVYTYQMLGGANFEPTGGLNFVPPLRCSDKSSINFIPEVDKIGNTSYEGKLLILAETGKEVKLNGAVLPAALFNPVAGNPGYVTYKAPGLTGNVQVESNGALQVGLFGRNSYAGWAGYFSGFDQVVRPEIAITIKSNCGDTLQLANLLNADSVVWVKDGLPLSQASDTLLTGVQPGTYFAIAYREFCGDYLWDTSVQVIIPEPLRLEVTTTPVTCPEIAAGSLTITTLSGGFLPYEISFDEGASFGTTTALDSLAAGSYPVWIRDSLGCVFRDTAEVLLDPQVPVLDLLTPPPLTCLDTTQLIELGTTSTGGNFTGTWSGPFGQVVADLDQAFPVDQAGTYILQITNNDNGCVRSDTVEVIADQQPPIAVLPPGGVLTCKDTLIQVDATLQSSGTFTYAWSTTDGLLTGNVDSSGIGIQAPGQYTLVITDSNNGCTTELNTQITADQVSPPVVLAEPEVLTCILTGQWIGMAGSSSPQWELLWTGPDQMPVPGGTADSLYIQQPGWYALAVTDPDNGCVAVDSILVTQDIIMPVLALEADHPLTCLDTVATLQADLEDCAGCDLTWWGPPGSWSPDPNALVQPVDEPGWYILTVIHPDNGCQAVDSVEVVQVPAPESMSIGSILPTCDEPFGQLSFGAVTGGVPPYGYSFDGGQTFGASTVLYPAPPGNYTLVVRDQSGCTLSVDTSMIAYAPFTLTLDAQVGIAYGESYPIEVTTSLPIADIQSILWEPAANLSCSDCLNPVASPLVSTTYQITVTDRNGCPVVATIRIDVALEVDVYIPNAFHPDQNGINDGFTVFADPAKVTNIRELRIFDRWGNAIFLTRDIPVNRTDLGWDGTYRGEPMDPAVFVYLVEVDFIDGSQGRYKGDVQLVR